MEYQWNITKATTNIARHGISFESAMNFDWNTALIRIDDRRDYGEERRQALGFIGTELYMMVYTMRDHQIRLISVRRAHRKERKIYNEHRKEKDGA